MERRGKAWWGNKHAGLQEHKDGQRRARWEACGIRTEHRQSFEVMVISLGLTLSIIGNCHRALSKDMSQAPP